VTAVAASSYLLYRYTRSEPVQAEPVVEAKKQKSKSALKRGQTKVNKGYISTFNQSKKKGGV
jgi:hypothetical protein